jgi:hypothetical protein
MDLDFIIAPAVLWICVTGIYKILELYARRRERMVIIEKFGDRFDPSLLSSISPNFPKPDLGKSYGALKVGCLLLGLGVGLLVGLLINTALIANGYDLNDHHSRRELFSVAYSASVLAFGGTGLLAAFMIELKLANREKQR